MIIIQVILFNIISSQNSYLLFPIIKEKSSFTIKVIINNHSLHFLPIDQSKNIILISDSHISSNESLLIDDSFINVKQCSTPIIIDSLKTKNEIIYYSYNKEDFPNKALLGLSYSYSNLHMSLVHNFYSSNDISKRQYGFYFTDDSDSNGYIFLGNYPISANKVMKCKILSENYITWNCDLQYIKMKSKVQYTNSHYSYFNIKEEGILVPFSFYEHFELYLDVNYNDNCKNLVGDHRYSFRCKSSYINTLPTIEFSFDNTLITFEMISLFKCNNTLNKDFDCDSYIYYDGTVKDTFIFGYPFMKDYYTVFDYDNKEVTFYTNNSNDKREKVKTIYIINIIFLIISIIVKCYN